LSNLGKEKTPQATNITKSKETAAKAPQVVKRTPTKETMSLDVANKAPQAFKGKDKAAQKSSGGSPRRKLVIHGLIDDKQPQKTEEIAHHLKGIIRIGDVKL
jgi:hypothetical protein